MDTIKKALAAFIPNGMPLPVLAGPLRGRLWLAGAAPGPAKGLSTLFNRCEPGQLMEALRLANARPGGICFDIGAHSGLYTLLLARACKQIYAFEPLPRNLAYLVKTLAVNNVANARVIPWAVGGQTRIDGFQEGEHTSEGHLDPAGTMPVFSVTCDEFSARYRAVPTLVKIDVEGAELDVLKGAVETLRMGRPDILLSTHGDGPKKDCLEFLRGLGYTQVTPLDAPAEAAAREFSLSSP